MEELITFDGRFTGTSVEDFVRAVRKQAFDMGMISNPKWMAEFASICMAGPALHWYSSLEYDVQGDWRLLQKALLSREPPEIGGQPPRSQNM